MKKFIIGLGFAIAALSVSAQVSIGFTAELAPGVYGQINVDNGQRPDVIYSQPRVMNRHRSYNQQPMYLYVPAHQQRHWNRYCSNYEACNSPVYFVREQWVRNRHEQEQRIRHDRQWRDRDHDGIPNRSDMDRDDDGVQNNKDRYPNNPNRR